MEDQDPEKRQRRVRYKGTHPKAFKEKYKELDPELYADDIAKVMEQGRTPAGMHRSICVNEIMDFLQIAPGQRGLDATLGYGGHSAEMLKQLVPGGHLTALDVDPIELPKTKERLAAMGFGEDLLTVKELNFSKIDTLCDDEALFHFVLADLGVSSMQIDNPERGFSFKVEGPLDLRLNPTIGKSAAEFLKIISKLQLEELLIENSDEPHASAISQTIAFHLSKGKKIRTTTDLQEIIKEALIYLPEVQRKEEIKKSSQRCFQALRIAVNDEFGVLDKFLEKLPYVLAPGGRVAILSFHSGEDRRVKKSFQNLFRGGIYQEISSDVIRPSLQEINSNPRAKSAKLRWAVRC